MASIDGKPISSMKVAELKDELKARGLDTKGTKPVLLKRLKEFLDAEEGDDNVQEESFSNVDTTTEMDESTTEQTEEPAELEPPPKEVAETEPEPEPELQPEPEPEVEPEPEPDPATEPEPDQEAEQLETQAKDEPQQMESEQNDVEQKPEENVEDNMESEPVENGATEEKKTEEEEEEDKIDTSAIPGGFAVIDEVGDTDNKDDRDRRDRRDRRRSRSRSPHGRRSRSRSRSRSRERRRRSRSPPSYRSQQGPPEMETDEWVSDTNVILDHYNCDLNLKLNGQACHPLSFDGFAFMWAGVRATYGVTSGKVAYEVKITEYQKVSHLPEDETNPHVVRVGWSIDMSDLQLGEVPQSYGYGGTAKVSENCKFRDYGEKYGKDDVITAYLDFEGPAISISYAKNGVDLGECFSVSHETLAGTALFPHVLTKNCAFECNFGQNEEPWFPLKEGFTFINTIPVEERSRGSLPPEKKEDCEMLMMCGLPGCGKTTWATKYSQEQMDKKYYVLGTNNIIDKMKVMGLPRKRNYAGRWDVLIDKSTKCLNKLFEIASRKKRNYILDQTNVYPSAQRRKMRPFEGFQRKAIVIVPTDDDFKARVEKREKEEGKDVPDKAVLEMKANFQIPVEGNLFDKVEFIELQREEASKLVEEYNKEGRAACPPRGDRHNDRSQIGVSGGRGRYDNRDRRDYRDRDRRYDDRRGGGRDRYGGGGGGYHRDRDYGGRSGGGGYGGRSYDRHGGRDDRRGYAAGGGGYGSGSYGYSSGGGGSWAGWGQQSWGQGYGNWSGYQQGYSQPHYGGQQHQQQQQYQYWQYPQGSQQQQQYNWYYQNQQPKK